MQNRRDFVKMLALLAAGAAAMPAQIEAFTRFYEINTPPGQGPFIAIDEIMLNGMATTSSPVYFTLLREDTKLLPMGINAFGGVIRWTAKPDQKVIGDPKTLRWQMRFRAPDGQDPLRPDYNPALAREIDDDWLANNLTGHISYIAQDGLRMTRIIDRTTGRLA